MRLTGITTEQIPCNACFSAIALPQQTPNSKKDIHLIVVLHRKVARRLQIRDPDGTTVPLTRVAGFHIVATFGILPGPCVQLFY